MSDTPRSREALGYLLGLIGVIIFGGTLPATRLAVASLDPWFVTFGRAAIAGVLSALVLLILRRKRPDRRQVRLILATAVMVTCGFPGFMGVAMTTVPAAHGGVVLGVLPLTTAALAALWNRQHASPAFWLLAVIGAAIVVGYSLRGGGGHLSIGDIYLFLAALCASLGYVISADLTRDMPGWEVICWVCLYALPVTVPLALWWMPADVAAVTLPSWLGFAYAALFSQFIGFFAWNAGLALGGVQGVSQIQLLQTFFTLGFAALINGEAIGWDTLAVAAVIVALLVLSRHPRVRG